MASGPNPTEQAVVVAALPQQLFRLRTEGGALVVAGPSTAAQRLGWTAREGDRVRVRLAASDPQRGVILHPSE